MKPKKLPTQLTKQASESGIASGAGGTLQPEVLLLATPDLIGAACAAEGITPARLGSVEFKGAHEAAVDTAGSTGPVWHARLLLSLSCRLSPWAGVSGVSGACLGDLPPARRRPLNGLLQDRLCLWTTSGSKATPSPSGKRRCR